MTIDINAVNSPPVATDDYATTEEDTPVNFNVLDGSSGGADSDPDGDALTIALLNGPADGVLTLNPNGIAEYIPDKNFHGRDSFVYTISDGNGELATATGVYELYAPFIWNHFFSLHGLVLMNIFLCFCFSPFQQPSL